MPIDREFVGLEFFRDNCFAKKGQPFARRKDFELAQFRRRTEAIPFFESEKGFVEIDINR